MISPSSSLDEDLITKRDVKLCFVALLFFLHGKSDINPKICVFLQKNQVL